MEESEATPPSFSTTSATFATTSATFSTAAATFQAAPKAFSATPAAFSATSSSHSSASETSLNLAMLKVIAESSSNTPITPPVDTSPVPVPQREAQPEMHGVKTPPLISIIKPLTSSASSDVDTLYNPVSKKAKLYETSTETWKDDVPTETKLPKLGTAPAVGIMSALNLRCEKPEVTKEALATTSAMSMPQASPESPRESPESPQASPTTPASLASLSEAFLQRNHMAALTAANTPKGPLTMDGMPNRPHPGRSPRHQLPLELKIETIRLHDEHGLSARAITELMNQNGFKCGKTQIQNIIKRKHDWIEQYAKNAPLDRKRKLRKNGNTEINARVYTWFEDRLDKAMPVNGPLLQMKAVEIARELGIMDFKGSNGWLESFRKRHSITFGTKATPSSVGEGISDSPTMLPRIPGMFMASHGDLATSLGGLGDSATPGKQNMMSHMMVGEFIKMNGLGAGAPPPPPPLLPPLPGELKDRVWDGKHPVSEGHPPGHSISVTGKDQERRAEEKKWEEEEMETEQTSVMPEEGKVKSGTSKKHRSRRTKLKSIHDVAKALQEIRVFLATRNYSHLLDSCMDLEDQVAEECAAERTVEEPNTVLDHLNPLDTRPVPTSD